MRFLLKYMDGIIMQTLTLEIIKKLMYQASEIITQQAIETKELELLPLAAMYLHIGTAIEKGCFQQVKEYIPDPSIMPIDWNE